MTPTSSIQTDPTYLRYIVDGLENQSLHRDGIASLPDGLIGIYEEAIPNDRHLGIREKFLDFFAIWALLKKEVSVSFIVPLLYWESQVAMDFLSLHTKWFNSPSSGKYLLYHDRLRVYLLERIQSHKLDKTNRKIIAACQSALQQPFGDEWEQYALEHLPSHLLIPAMQHEADGAAFKQLVNDTAFWNRQLEVSKSYDWTKKMLNESMTWAAKQNTDELIGFALNKVDLHYMEQNDAPRIVELVAQNDLDTALQRIEAFGGNDKEGLQRKFTLYMLCLMELTLLDSKEKPFRRSAIERLLNHLDEKLPIDHSILNWNDFFPSYLMFQLACDWEEMGLDYLRLYQRADSWAADWIPEKGPYSNSQFDIMLTVCREIVDQYPRCVVMSAIHARMLRQGMAQSSSVLEEILELVRSIHGSARVKILCNIADQLNEIGTIQFAQTLILEAIEWANGIDSKMRKSHVFSDIAIAFARQGNMEKAIECTTAMNVIDKCRTLPVISTEMIKRGKEHEASLLLAEALSSANNITDALEKGNILISILSEVAKQGNVPLANSIVEEALTFAQGIEEASDRHNLLMEISIQLTEQGKLDQTLNVLQNVSDVRMKCFGFREISVVLDQQRNHDEASNLLQEALEFAQLISSYTLRFFALGSIANRLVHQGKVEAAARVLLDTLPLPRGITEDWQKAYTQKCISFALAKKDKLSAALECSGSIAHESWKSNAQADLALELAKRGKYLEANESVKSIPYGRQKRNALALVAIEMAKQGMIEDAVISAYDIEDDQNKGMALCEISIEMAKKGNFEKALVSARDIADTEYRIKSFIGISLNLFKEQQVSASLSLTNEALATLRSIEDVYIRSRLLCEMLPDLLHLGMAPEVKILIQDLLTFAEPINDEEEKSRALFMIATTLAKIGQPEKSRLVKEDALFAVHGISDIWTKCSLLHKVAIDLVNQVNWNIAEQVVMEIPLIAERQETWKKIAEVVKSQSNFQLALDHWKTLVDKESALFYVKGLAEAIDVNDVTTDMVYGLLFHLVENSINIENLLQAYAQYELFFGNPSPEKINRLNKTLNLQWVMDIHAKIA
jgi:tetratricopeptide (TPR) repeat protein